MAGIGQWFSDKWNEVTGKTPQKMAAPISQALPSGPDIGAPPEPAGMTTAGGRRLSKMKKGKTRKAHKKSRKTRKH